MLGAIPGLLHLMLAITVACVVVDYQMRRIELTISPQMRYAVWFMVWGLLTTAVKSPDVFFERLMDLLPTACVMLALGFGCASPRGLRIFVITLVGCAVLVTCVALKQAYTPLECMISDPVGESLTPDGRACEVRADCWVDAPDPYAEYRCERPGPFATTTIADRVRYRGTLHDPNDLSLMAGMTIPFALTLTRRNRRLAHPSAGLRLAPSPRPYAPAMEPRTFLSWVSATVRMLFVTANLAGIGTMIVFARSRMGLIVYLVIITLCVLQRHGLKGIFVAGFAGTPMVMFGGRSGDEAEGSTDARIELLRDGFDMIQHTMGIGIGVGQFADESPNAQTAHNSYLLAAAETGVVGVCLFALLLYTSLKVSFKIWRGGYNIDTTVLRFAAAVFVSLCGALVGIFFLSWSYKDMLYIVVGASMALYGIAHAQDPRISIRLSKKEIVAVCCAIFTLLGVLNIYLHIRR
ncbi:O-antigen ligase family protein [Sorangium sp. So ce375]|uniref:O-antigen ligase family protein n=1 Tax=Sorangium sp. So ce375 TaxID=3133306 RepID=UPI003F5B96AC